MYAKPNAKIYNDLGWETKRAPVVPPAWVVDLVRETGRPVFWENSGTVFGYWDEKHRYHPGSYVAIIYQTVLSRGKIVTRLCPGSFQPVDGWLQ